MGFDPYLEWLNIPPHRRPPSNWDLLGLEEGSVALDRIHEAAADRLERVRRYANSPQADVAEAALRIQGELSRALIAIERVARAAESAEVVHADEIAGGKPHSAPAATGERPAEAKGPPWLRVRGILGNRSLMRRAAAVAIAIAVLAAPAWWLLRSSSPQPDPSIAADSNLLTRETDGRKTPPAERSRKADTAVSPSAPPAIPKTEPQGGGLPQQAAKPSPPPVKAGPGGDTQPAGAAAKPSASVSLTPTNRTMPSSNTESKTVKPPSPPTPSPPKPAPSKPAVAPVPAAKSPVVHTAVLGNWLDLVRNVDLNRDTVRGDWRLDRQTLRINARGSEDRIMLPVVIHEGGFELELKFTRYSGSDPVAVIFPVRDSACSLCLGGWNGRTSLLSVIDGWPAPDKNRTSRPADIQNGRAYHLLLRVVYSGERVQVDVQLDEKPYIAWSGDASRAGFKESWALPVFERPGLWVNRCNVAFHAVSLRMLGGRATLLARGRVYRDPVKSTQQVGSTSWTGFRELAPPQGCLAGFRFYLDEHVRGIAAIYESQPGERQVSKQRFGPPGKQVRECAAREGYAVGAIRVYVGSTEISAVVGMQLVFMRRKGAHLDRQDQYTSDLFGRTGTLKILDGRGQSIVGIRGTRSYSRGLTSLGLLLPDTAVDRSN